MSRDINDLRDQHASRARRDGGAIVAPRRLTARSVGVSLLLACAVLAAHAQGVNEGEVRRVDTAQKKITLKHGEIKNLDIPPTVMAFSVRDPAMVDKVKAGDKVRFSADKVGGAYTITAIEVVK